MPQKREWITPAMLLFSSRQGLQVLEYLADPVHGRHMGGIRKGTGIAATSLGNVVRKLESAGLLHGDLPPEQRRGRSVNYALNTTRITKIITDAHKHLMP